MKTSIKSKFDVSTDSELLSISGSVQPKLNAKNDRTVDLDQNTPKQSEVNKKNKNGSNVLKIGNWNIKRDLVTVRYLPTQNSRSRLVPGISASD